MDHSDDMPDLEQVTIEKADMNTHASLQKTPLVSFFFLFTKIIKFNNTNREHCMLTVRNRFTVS